MATDDPQRLSGLARSIEQLFSDAEKESVEEPPGAVATGEEPVEGEVSAPREEASSGPSPEVLKGLSVPEASEHLERAVTRYLLATASRRDALGGEVRAYATVLREANQLDPLADAVERLVIGAGDPPDPTPVALAQRLTSPAVASRIAARLASAREGDRREVLLRVAMRLGDEMAEALADAVSDATDRSARRNYMEAIVALGEPGMRVAESMVQDGRWFVVRNGVAILGEIGGEAAVEHLTSTLAHTDGRVRREALLALAKLGGENAGILVTGMLEDPDDDVKAAAALAVGALRVQRAQRALIGLLDHDNDDVKEAALRALGQLGDPGAVSAIEKHAVGSFFSRPKADVRIAAYRALAGIGTPHARGLLENAADDKDPEVRTAVRALLARR